MISIFLFLFFACAYLTFYVSKIRGVYKAGKEMITHLLGKLHHCSEGTLSELVNDIIKTNTKKLKIQKKELLDASNPELIHDMRVASRRLRAAFNTFKSILPSKAQKIRKKLKKLSLMLGKKRDLDVFLEFIHPLIDEKTLKLSEQAYKLQKKFIAIIKSKFYARMIEALEDLRVENDDGNVCKVAKKKISGPLGKVLDIANLIHSKADDKMLHKLRISIKKLRYVCEFFEPPLGRRWGSLSTFINKTKKIQDALGDYHDSLTGLLILNKYKKDFSSRAFLKIQKKLNLKKKETRKLFFRQLRGSKNED